MPLYEYECQACHRRTEKIQKFSDAELTVCPHCGGRLERTVTAAAFAFAGGGWYKDGYGSAKPAAGEAKSESGASGDAKPGESKTSDTKSNDSKSSESTSKSSESKGSDSSPAKPATPAPAAKS